MTAGGEARGFTRADGLTALRFLVAPLYAFSLFSQQHATALGLFSLAVASDVLDGWTARRRGEASARGALFDHATDAWLVTLAAAALAARGLAPVALPVLIAAAFTQYALDSRALAGQRLRGSRLGRVNGIAYWVLPGIPTVRDALSLAWPTDRWVGLLAMALVATTLLSMADRALALWAARRTPSGAAPVEADEEGAPAPPPKRSLAMQLASWAGALFCFWVVYRRVEAAALRDGLSPEAYLASFFAEADWLRWLALMLPYSLFFVLVDTHATWRVVRWYNAPAIRFGDVLPVRASAYILSVLSEQVGKGAMSLYLWRRHRVPGWEALSSMILLSLVEIYQLLLFSAAGVALYPELVRQASSELPLLAILSSVYTVAALYFPLHLAYFSGRLLPRSTLREARVLSALRRATLRDYLLVLLFKAPNLLMAVVVYTAALGLFRVDIGFGQMLAFLPVIFLAAALPLPFHAGALLLWAVLFPEFPQVGAFSLVMHSFFVAANATIGIAFLPRANRELFGTRSEVRT